MELAPLGVKRLCKPLALRPRRIGDGSDAGERGVVETEAPCIALEHGVEGWPAPVLPRAVGAAGLARPRLRRAGRDADAE